MLPQGLPPGLDLEQWNRELVEGLAEQAVDRIERCFVLTDSGVDDRQVLEAPEVPEGIDARRQIDSLLAGRKGLLLAAQAGMGDSQNAVQLGLRGTVPHRLLDEGQSLRVGGGGRPGLGQ